jgi:predicted transcriptional regulator
MDDQDLVPLLKRASMLEALLAEPRTTRELEHELSASRSTIHRATAAFVERGLLTDTDDGVVLTPMGRVLAREVVRFRDRAETAHRLAVLFDEETSDAELPLSDLTDARVVEPSPRRPYVVLETILDRIRSAESIRLISAVASPLYLDALAERVDAGATVDAIFPREVVEILFSEYGDLSREMAREGPLTVRIHDGCPFDLFVFDDAMGIASHQRNGGLEGFVECEDQNAVAWARERFQQCANEAEYATIF